MADKTLCESCSNGILLHIASTAAPEVPRRIFRCDPLKMTLDAETIVLQCTRYHPTASSQEVA